MSVGRGPRLLSLSSSPSCHYCGCCAPSPNTTRTSVCSLHARARQAEAGRSHGQTSDILGTSNEHLPSEGVKGLPQRQGSRGEGAFKKKKNTAVTSFSLQTYATLEQFSRYLEIMYGHITITKLLSFLLLTLFFAITNLLKLYSLEGEIRAS